MDNKRKVKRYVIALILIIAMGVVAAHYPVRLSAEEVAELQDYYKASEDECVLMDYLENERIEMTDPIQKQTFLSLWDELTIKEYSVNRMYMALNLRQKWYARFHSNPPLLTEVTE